jgi:hypothetical protein
MLFAVYNLQCLWNETVKNTNMTEDDGRLDFGLTQTQCDSIKWVNLIPILQLHDDWLE